MKNRIAISSVVLALLMPEACVWAYDAWIRVREHTSAEINVAQEDILGDQIDIDTGVLSLYTVDVSLPGNNDLPVQFGRRVAPSIDGDRYWTGEMRNWYSDKPKIIGAATCNDFDPDPSYWDDWGGAYVSVPNEPRKRFFPLKPSYAPFYKPNTEYVTNDFWMIECVGPNQTFLVTSPRGVKYHFDVTWSDDKAYASLIEDVNGNWVRYEYDTSHSMYRPTRIHSSDGREITTTPVSGGSKIGQVSANGRTWTYSYGSNGDLSTVTLPDGRTWTLGDTNAIDDYEHNASRPNLTIEHPSGVSGLFEFDIIKNGRTYAQRRDFDCDDCEYRKYFRSKAVVKKTLTVPNAGTYVWDYEYEEDLGSYRTEPELHPTKYRTITDPNGDKTKHYVRRRWDYFEGLIVKTEVFNAGSAVPVETTEFAYRQGAKVGYASDFVKTSNSLVHEYQRLLIQKTVTRGTDIYTTNYTYAGINTSATGWGSPVQIDESSNVSTGTRTTAVEYETERDDWVIGLVESVTKNGVEFERNGYDTLGRRVWTDRFGVRDETLAYHTADPQKGAVSWSKNGLNQITYYRNWHRGQPQEVERPDGVKVYQTIDNNGWVTSETDANGNVTGYSYNSVGWRTAVNYPSGWADTSISYSSLGNGLVQTTSRGTERVTTTYDGLHRPILVRRQALSGGGGNIYAATEHDHLGRITFLSWPSASSNPTAGTTTSYDALGRITSESETVSPFATTSYEYLNGNKTRVTDALGNSTTSTFSGYGNSSDGNIVKIEQPLDITTELSYDLNGYLTSARQHGSHNGYVVDQTQHYYYDSRYRLCRHSVPESNDTLYEYDLANQLVGTARGQSPGSGCASLPVNAKIQNVYDSIGRLSQINYPDSSPDISFNYDGNGNTTSVARGTTNWTYAYNGLNLLTSETLVVDGRTYSTSYQYNSNGFLNQQTTPASRVITYAPDGLGRPTSLIAGSTTYASAITYHPNEYLKSLNYGNGHALTTTQNPRLQLATLIVQKGATKAVSLNYDYDAVGRVTQINDLAVSGNNKSLTYDAVNRLTYATGSWGTAAYTYDSLGNLRRKSVGSRLVQTQYNGLNRLTSVSDTGSGGAWKPYSYDARGNVTSNTRLSFTYDLSNQPTAISGDASGSFSYDGHHRRVKQNLDGETIYSVYSKNGTLLYRDNITTNKATDYLRVATTQVARIENSAITYTHGDHLGSPISATNTAGTVLWRENYLPFGEKTLDPSGNQDDEGFTGHISDAATGLTYMQARYFDPVIGRFMAVDPAQFAADQPMSFNRYSYGNNNPYSYQDPDGRVAKLLKASYNVFKRWRKSGDLKGAIKDEVINFVDNVSTLADGQLTVDDAFAAIDIVTGFGGEAKKITNAVTCCFVAGTLVDTEDGLRPIEEIAIGDLVWAQDVDLGTTELKPVTDLIHRHARQIWIVELAANDGSIVQFETTDDHPWWITDAGWVDTVDLAVGMLATTRDGLEVRVVHVENTDRTAPTFNLTVADFETYFVGDERVLVHNCPAYPPGGRKGAYGNPSNSAAARNARAEAEGKPCPKCGNTMESGTPHAPQAQHNPALSDHFNEHGGKDMTSSQRREWARSEDAIDGANCRRCQGQEGVEQREKYRFFEHDDD